jgi:hypothetical protein
MHPECTIEKLGDSICDTECNNKGCAYDFGDCVYVCNKGCSKCYEEMGDIYCLECIEGYYLLYGRCVSECYIGFQPTIKLGTLVCEPATDISTESNPFVIYVSQQVLIPEDQIGDIEHPFSSLSTALSYIRYKYTRIYLLNYNDSSHILQKLNMKDFQGSRLSRPTSPLDFGNIVFSQNIEILPQYCRNSVIEQCYFPDTMAKILWRGSDAVELYVRNSMIIQNVEFDGYNFIASSDNGEESDYLTYCPFVSYDARAGVLYNDKGEQVNWRYASKSDCDRYKNATLFRLNNGTLRLNNVTFINWRAGFFSLITGYIPKLYLSNVNFINIKTNNQPYSAVLSFYDCEIDSYDCGIIIYEYGAVKLLNNGYEYNDENHFSGFLYSRGINELSISSINFEQNLVYKGKLVQYETYDNTGTLIYNENTLSLTMINNTFRYNISDRLINLKMLTSYQKENSTQPGSLFISYIVFIKNNTFSHIYGDIIQLYFYTQLPIIRIETCRFEDIVYNQHIIDVRLYEIGNNNSEDGRLLFLIGPIDPVYVTFFYMFEIYISRCYGSSSVISLENLQDVDLTSLEITHSLQPCDYFSIQDLIQDMVYSYLISLDHYISHPFYSKILNIPLNHSENLLYLYSMVKLIINNFISSNNYSSMGGTDLYISNPSESFLLQGLTIQNNIANCKRYGSGISFYSPSLDIQLSNISAYNNTNLQGYGTVLFSNYDKEKNFSLTISDSIFEKNSAAFGAGIAILSARAEIKNVRFESNAVIESYGGAVYFNPNLVSESISIVISECEFLKNTVRAGLGGAIAIDNYSNISGIKILFNLTSSQFIENTSLYHASSIYIGSKVDLQSDSTLLNCNFTRNISEKKANILIEHRSGVLTFDTCNFQDNESDQGIVMNIVTSQTSQESPCKVVIHHSSFVSNRPLSNPFASLIEVGSSLYYSTLETSFNTFSYNSGTAFFINYGIWIDTSSIFENNAVYSSAIAKITNSGRAELTSTSMFHNSSVLKGGAFLLNSKSILIVNDSIISNNLSLQDGGVIFMNDESIVWIQNSKISKNEAKKGSFIYATECNFESSYVLGCDIYSNYSKRGGMISLHKSILNISSSYIFNNTDSLLTPAIYLAFSTLNVSYSLFKDQTAEIGSAIYSTSQSRVFIASCEFKDLISTTKGGAIFSYYSRLSIINSSFRHVTSDQGGSIFAYSEGRVEVKDSIFEYSTARKEGGIMKLIEGQAQIFNCTFGYYDATGIYAENVRELNIDQSFFRDGVGMTGGAILCKTCLELSITSSTFNRNSAYYGGAVYLNTSKDDPIHSSYTLFNNTFYSNSAKSGGSIYSNNLNLWVYNNTFEENIAKSDDHGVDGDGGAIKIECYEAIRCWLNIVMNSFKYNLADRNGGAISWKHFQPIIQDNLFINNTAQYGNDIASFPLRVVLIDNYNSSLFIINSTNFATEKFNLVAPGQAAPSIHLALVDISNQIVSTENSIIAELNSPNKSVLISGETKIKAYKGLFNFSDFTISGLTGSNITISITQSPEALTNGLRSPDLMIETSLYLKVFLRDCVIGEKESNGKCITCPAETYSLDPMSGTCLACPKEAECYGESQITPKKGYWRVSSYSDRFFECPYSKACIGSRNTSNVTPTGECARGYMGNLCATCARNYSKSASETCEECGNITENAFKLTGIILMIAAVFAVTVKFTLKSAHNTEALHPIYIKIFLNYLQLVMLTTSINFNWAEISKDFISIQQFVGSISEQIFSYDCLLSDYHNTLSPQDIYFLKQVFIVLLPIIIICIAIIIFGTLAMAHFTSKYIKDDLIATVIILLFLIHPNIVEHLFSTFSCTELEPGEYWIRKNYDIRCWDNEHTYYIYRVVLPGILVWGLGVPAVCLAVCMKNRRKLNNISFRFKFGFLLNGYCKNYYYWEFFILYRKLLIIFCSAFLSSISVHIQALSICILLLASLYIHQKHRPFYNNELNEMERRSTMVAIGTIYSGMYYMTRDMDYITEVILFISIILINIYFAAYWIYKLLEISGKLLQTVPCLRLILRRRPGDGYDKDLLVSRKRCRTRREIE